MHEVAYARKRREAHPHERGLRLCGSSQRQVGVAQETHEGGSHTGVGARCSRDELAERNDFDGAEFARWGLGLVVFMFVFPRMLAVMFS